MSESRKRITFSFTHTHTYKDIRQWASKFYIFWMNEFNFAKINGLVRTFWVDENLRTFAGTNDIPFDCILQFYVVQDQLFHLFSIATTTRGKKLKAKGRIKIQFTFT